ncbi:MAG: hypothetical protein KIS78_14280 [Labilithrix sp.]|nr:hypothetical protein [Labilithrix sp.]MCW5833566.1 hypothetical protein [Labilithrix sp.]
MPSLRGAALASTLVAACAPILGVSELEVDERDASGPPVETAPTASTSEATPPPPPPEDAGDPPDAPSSNVEKRVFVTSGAFNGVMGGVSGVDARCVAAADRATLGGDWIAWISADGKNAIDRVIHDGPYVRLDGARVVRNKAQLVTGVLTSPIDRTETGERVTENHLVWTGTLVSGIFSTDCDNWSSNNAVTYGAMGTLSRTDRAWTDNGGPGPGFRNWGCQTLARLYCFER